MALILLDPGRSRHRVIIPYHPGWGESGDAPNFTTLHDYVLHYLDLFDQLKLERFSLVGLSLGGLLSATFAIEHAHRLKKLVLVAPPGMHVPDHPTADLSRIPPEQIPELFGRGYSGDRAASSAAAQRGISGRAPARNAELAASDAS